MSSVWAIPATTSSVSNTIADLSTTSAGVFDHGVDVGVFGQNVSIRARLQATTRDPQDGGVTMQDCVHLVPMLLGTCTEKINLGEVDRTLHWPKFVVDVLWLHAQTRSPPAEPKL